MVCGSFLVCVTSGEVGESVDSLPAVKTRCAPRGVEGVSWPFGTNANASSSNSSSVSSSLSAARSDAWWPRITSGAVRLRRDALGAREAPGPPGPVFICGKSTGAVGVGRGSATVNMAADGRARLKIVRASLFLSFDTGRFPCLVGVPRLACRDRSVDSGTRVVLARG